MQPVSEGCPTPQPSGGIPEAVVISDVHIGSRYFRRADFLRFLDMLPPGAALIMNGDVVTRRHTPLPARDRAVIDRLCDESRKREVIWVRGNHDRRYAVEQANAIRFKPNHAIGKRLFIDHGARFDGVMPFNKPFILLFRAFHRLRMLFGAQSVHVAFYAKRWALLYRVLRTNVTTNAVQYAREHGYAAVACGHTHFPEDVTVGATRYLNTGSWTEQPAYRIDVTADDITLKEIPGGQSQ